MHVPITEHPAHETLTALGFTIGIRHEGGGEWGVFWKTNERTPRKVRTFATYGFPRGTRLRERHVANVVDELQRYSLRDLMACLPDGSDCLVGAETPTMLVALQDLDPRVITLIAAMWGDGAPPASSVIEAAVTALGDTAAKMTRRSG